MEMRFSCCSVVRSDAEKFSPLFNSASRLVMQGNVPAVLYLHFSTIN